MRFQVACAGAIALALAAGGAPERSMAHHSFAMFDMNKQVTVSGTVKQFQWTNPHAYIQLVAKDDAGRDVEWSMEMGAPMYLYARGWRPRTLRAGSAQRHPQPAAQRPAGRRGARRDRRRRQADRDQSMKVRFAAAAGRGLPGAGGPAPAQDAPARRAPRRSPSCRTGPATGSASSTPSTTIGGSAAPRPAGSPPLQRLNASNAPWNEEGKAAPGRSGADAGRAPGGRLGLSDDDGRGHAVPGHDHARRDDDRQRVRRDRATSTPTAARSRRKRTCGRPCGAPRSAIGRATRWSSKPCRCRCPTPTSTARPSFSEEARYFERMRLDGDRLVTELTVEDPVTLTAPWSATISHVREEGFDRMVQMDFSNDRTGRRTASIPSSRRPMRWRANERRSLACWAADGGAIVVAPAAAQEPTRKRVRNVRATAVLARLLGRETRPAPRSAASRGRRRRERQGPSPNRWRSGRTTRRGTTRAGAGWPKPRASRVAARGLAGATR